METGWNQIELNQIIDLMRNGFSGKQVDFVTQFPVTRIETIADGKINFAKVGFVEKIPRSYKLAEGDILISNINSIKHMGKVAQFSNKLDSFHGMNLLILRIKDNVEKTFIFYLLQFNKSWFERMASQAVNQASINQTIIRSKILFIPKSKREQTKIAEILSAVDKAIEQTEAIIAKQQRIKTGLMQDLLTKGIDENGNIRSEETHEFKDSPPGRIPAEWEWATIDDISIYVGSGITPKGGENVYSKEGVLFIRSQNVSFEGLLLNNVAHIPVSINKKMKRSEVFAHDVLLNITGASIGRCCPVPRNLGRANVNQHVCAIRMRETNQDDANFLSTILESSIGQNQIEKFNA
ncbi:EcoKI restriction-modification system protein HsdS [bacterium BMS3Abin03]|nr:EcoKI restriction-modification system protein HsdS [bacterium BMS3Abin03]